MKCQKPGCGVTRSMLGAVPQCESHHFQQPHLQTDQRFEGALGNQGARPLWNLVLPLEWSYDERLGSVAVGVQLDECHLQDFGV